jgi:ABC-type sulfate/molybdate transport systems ATPase subunit
MKDVFVDRFLKCTASQGVVRLDFGRVESIDNDKNEISVAPSARLVLPMDGFVHFVDQAVQLRDQMLEQEKNSSQKSKNTKDSDLSASEKKDTDSVH